MFHLDFVGFVITIKFFNFSISIIFIIILYVVISYYSFLVFQYFFGLIILFISIYPLT